MREPINLLTKSETAELLGCSEKTVMRLVDAGKLPKVAVSERLVRFDEDDVYAYMESRKTAAKALQRKTRIRRPSVTRVCTYKPGDKVV